MIIFLTKSQQIPPEHIGQKPIMLSFDDGYKNIYTNLLPILEKLETKYGRKVKVVLFVNQVPWQITRVTLQFI
jgi:hypothetical protein